MLLSQENPHTIARAMGYYRYFFTARNRLLQQYRETLQQLRKLEQRIADMRRLEEQLPSPSEELH